MGNIFEEATVKAIIKKANPYSAAGSSGPRYNHLQAALCDEMVKDVVAIATLVVSSRVLPQVFWTTHTSVNLSGLGKKARPVVCGHTFSGGFSAPRFDTDTAGNWQSTSSHGPSTV